MTNKEKFDAANQSGSAEEKTIVRAKFLDWCQKNGRTPMNPKTITDWWMEEWK